MKIAIINDVHIGKPLERNQTVRAASHLAENALPTLLKHIVRQHSPDLFINLGDLIRSETKEIDLKRYEQALQHFSKLEAPVIHLVGNHDIKKTSVQEIEDIWKSSGFDQKSYGTCILKDHTVLWLGMECDSRATYKHKLPEKQLLWLEDTLQNVKHPVIIFTHCAVDDQIVDGNYFYEGYDDKNKYGFFLENYQKIQKIILNCSSVVAVVQAHLHYFHTKMINNLPFVTCPAMGDNICGPNVSDHIPEIYTLLTLNEEQLILKSFAREYCFAGAEFGRN